MAEIPKLITALLTIAKSWNQGGPPLLDEWMKKTWHIDTMEYYLAVKNTITSFTWKNVELDIIVLNKINQTQKDKYFSDMWIPK